MVDAPGSPAAAPPRGAHRLPLQLPKKRKEKMCGEKDMLTPPVGSHPLPRWARGPLSVPCRSGTLAYKLQVQDKEQDVLPHFPQLWTLPPPPTWEGYGATTCSVASDAASLLGRALMLPRVPRFRPCLPARKGSGAATCPTASDPASLLGMALTLSHVPRLWTLPPYSGGF
jgi:hypothetical protein